MSDDHDPQKVPWLSEWLEIFLFSLLVVVLLVLSALNLNPELPVPPANDDAAAYPDYLYSDSGSEFIDLDDLDSEYSESSPSEAEQAAGRSRTRSRSTPMPPLSRSGSRTRIVRARSFSRTRPTSRSLEQEQEPPVFSRASSRESLQPHHSETSLFGQRLRRRANDTESRGSEVYRLDPSEPYYRRRAASVPVLRQNTEER
jgi:hypothetical protein